VIPPSSARINRGSTPVILYKTVRSSGKRAYDYGIVYLPRKLIGERVKVVVCGAGGDEGK
jgi:hypothetical protein